MSRCVIISSSPKIEISFLRDEVLSDDFIICADGGYKHAEKAGLVPNIIIGDFDSAEVPSNTNATILKLPIKKDDTDTFSCVKEALSRGFDEIIIFGGTGGRMDHTYANISVLSYIRSHNARGTLIDESNSLMIISDEEMLIENKCGERFSIFAFGCESCVVTLSGFEYELEKGRLFAEIPLGISNVITADTAQVKIDEGSAVIIFSKE